MDPDWGDDSMSVWNHVFDSNIKQRADIEELRRRSLDMAQRQHDRASIHKKRIEALEVEVGELTLLCRTMLTLLRENGILNPEAMDRIMREIDLEDGVLDGRVTPVELQPLKPKRPPIHRRLK